MGLGCWGEGRYGRGPRVKGQGSKVKAEGEGLGERRVGMKG